MPADGMPNRDDSLLAPALRGVARCVTRWPKLVIVAAVVLTAISLVTTVAGLGFRTSRLDLLNPDSSYNRRWLAYLEEFGGDDDVVIVVEGAEEPAVVAAVAELGRWLEDEDELLFDLFYRRDFTRLKEKGLHFQSVESLRRLDDRLAELQPIVAGQWHRLNAASLLESATQRLLSAESRAPADGSGLPADSPLAPQPSSFDELQALIDALSAAVTNATYLSPWPAMTLDEAMLEVEPATYLLADGGRLGFLQLKLKNDESQFAGGAKSLARLRQIVRQAERRHPHVTIGLTGMPVLETDEMQASQSDMLRASLLSLLGVAVLFMAGFGGWRYPLVTVASLLIAMSWSFAFVTLGVGHLNILSVSFGAILIGLGIDFGIHFVAGYLEHRASALDCRAAIIATSGRIGPGIVTGGVTTAIAFFTAALTHFTGVAELGLIAGGGILLCIVAALAVLPALVQWMDHDRATGLFPRPLPCGALFEPLAMFPRSALAVGLIPVLVLGGGVSLLRFDHNLLNLQPRQLESAQLERKLIERADQSVWFALSMAGDRDEVRRRKQQFESLKSVERVEEIASLVPPESSQRTAAIIQIRERLVALPSQPPPIADPQVETLQAAVGQLRGTLDGLANAAPGMVAAGAGERTDVQGSLSKLATQLSEMPVELTAPRLTQFQHQAAAELLARLHQLRRSADAAEPSGDDLPAGLVSRFVGRNGQHLIRVYARGNIWDMDRLATFVRDVERVDPRITGHPIQTYYASRQMQQSYIHAAIYALLAVAIVLMLDFRSVTATLLAMLPVCLGMLQLFGLLGILGIPLNPANLIVLPLILGIGIDDGVHVVHDFRRQTGRYRLSNSTSKAIVLTSATTMLGFGCLMIAQHQGIRSLGQVLTLGVFCCLTSSLVVLPAVLTLVSPREAVEDNENACDRETLPANEVKPRRVQAA